MPINDIRLSPHFKLKEFQCRCCGTVKIHPMLLEALERLRELWGNPIVITSGYRCANHNREVGGAKESRHTKGFAVDVVCIASEQARVSKLAREAGFDQAIPYGVRNFIHLGVWPKG